ncbi:MAG: cupin domain-containing protein [Legionellales bacterium]|nr:cupin domain-containing protein [Legionellales bacterium]
MMTRSIRRLVTGHNEHGKSVLADDMQADCVLRPLAIAPELALINLWATGQSPVDILPDRDPARDIKGLVPSASGSIFRIVDFPPEETYIDKVSASFRDEAFNAMDASSCADSHKVTGHPFMHRTTTLDYAIVLEGEIYLLLDESEHLMSVGDVAIQCATNHAWSNRSNKTCRMAFILLDAKTP